MTETMTRPLAAGAPPEAEAVQKFGRIETVRFLAGGTEVDIRQPDGWPLRAVIAPQLARIGLGEAPEGCNIWVSGRILGDRMRVEQFEVLDEEG